jgi:hypothetical protein
MASKRKGSVIDRSGMTREEYATEYLVKRGVSKERAASLIKRHGADLMKLKEAAGVASVSGPKLRTMGRLP